MNSFLKIVLDPPSPGVNTNAYIYGPEEHVSGRAILTLAEYKTVESVIVDFKGKIVVNFDENTYHRYIFRRSETLFRGPFKMAPSTYEYPFSFQFLGSWNDTYVNSTNNFPFVVGVQSLPPTCQDLNPTHDYCTIYYNITAWIPGAFGDLTAKHPVRFAPYRVEAKPPPLIKSASHIPAFQRSYRLKPDGIPRPLTVAETWRESLHHSSQNHKIKFSVSAKAPTAIVIGTLYRIEVTLVSVDDIPEKHLPVFFLQHCELTAKYHTISREPGSHANKYHRDSHVPLGTRSDKIPLSCNTPIEIDGLFPSTPVRAISPTFAISSVRRKCDLEFKGTVSCLGDNVKFKVRWADVTMYPSRLMPGV
jgi:hypothetical protein